jgi:hypothetical protein
MLHPLIATPAAQCCILPLTIADSCYSYINPFFTNGIPSIDPSARRDYFKEGDANGYFIKNSTNQTYLINSVSIQSGMVDLTNPAAWDWMVRLQCHLLASPLLRLG